MKVKYLRYYGERQNGTIVIKSLKSNSPFRIFQYEKGMNLRVGVEVEESQVKFLTTNHKDLFRIVEEEVKVEDLIYVELFKFLPRIARQMDASASQMLRKLAEVAMLVFKVDFSPDDPEQTLEVLLNRLVEAYVEDISSQNVVRIFHGVVEDRIDTEKASEPASPKEKTTTGGITLKFGASNKEEDKLDGLGRKELKALIENEELDVKVSVGTKNVDVVKAIREARKGKK